MSRAFLKILIPSFKQQIAHLPHAPHAVLRFGRDICRRLLRVFKVNAPAGPRPFIKCAAQNAARSVANCALQPRTRKGKPPYFLRNTRVHATIEPFIWALLDSNQ